MGKVFFTSDFHLGHYNVANLRGFKTAKEQDDLIINNINKTVSKRDKLFILGDIAWKLQDLERINEISCKQRELILGNHDRLNTQCYLKYFNHVHGFRSYKGFWLSHCPIHPQEIMNDGNIHGHIHRKGDTNNINDYRYYNVNVDCNDYLPVEFNKIKIMRKEQEMIHTEFTKSDWNFNV